RGRVPRVARGLPADLPRAARAPAASAARDARLPMSERMTETSPRLAYVVRGTSGPDVLLIMGFGMGKELWEPQLAGLERTHRLVAFDNRGVGASERGDRRAFSMALLADDACRVLDAVGLERAHVVGVSMGGMIAQEM